MEISCVNDNKNCMKQNFNYSENLKKMVIYKTSFCFGRFNMDKLARYILIRVSSALYIVHVTHNNNYHV